MDESKQTQVEDKEKGGKKAGRSIISIISFVIVIVLAVYLIVDFTVSPGVSVRDGKLRISGTHAKTVQLVDVEVTVIQELTLLKRTSGMAMGNVRKGTFTAEGYEGKVYLNVMNRSIGIIRIYADGGYHFINHNTEEKTQQLYHKLLDLLTEFL